MISADDISGQISPAFGDVIERFDHVSAAVRDIDAMQPLLDLLGAEHFDGGLSFEGDFRWEQYRLPGGTRLELIASVGDDPAHFIPRFIRDRGEGLHHLTFKVYDIHAARDRAVELGFEVVGFDVAEDDWKELFLHPRSTHGVLVQLAEFPAKDG